MKKSLFMLFLAANISGVFAQDYYTGKSTVTAGGITYCVERPLVDFMLYIHDQNNKCEPFGSLYYHDGSLADQKKMGELMYQVADNGDILRATFTKEEYAEIQKKMPKDNTDESFTVALIVNPEGKVIEVSFFMRAAPGFLSLSPEKLALLEKNIKQMDKWEVTDDGKKLKYMCGVWLIYFSKNLFYPGEVQPDHPTGGGI